MKILYTIGYQNLTPGEFVKRLRENGVLKVIDVREIPHSRRPGFSKSKLKEVLATAGLEYIHIKELGSRQELRNKIRADGDFDYFKKVYLSIIRREREALNLIYFIAQEGTCCLVCVEDEPARCHRSLLAEEITRKEKNGLKVIHL